MVFPIIAVMLNTATIPFLPIALIPEPYTEAKPDPVDSVQYTAAEDTQKLDIPFLDIAPYK